MRHWLWHHKALSLAHTEGNPRHPSGRRRTRRSWHCLISAFTRRRHSREWHLATSTMEFVAPWSSSRSCNNNPLSCSVVSRSFGNSGNEIFLNPSLLEIATIAVLMKTTMIMKSMIDCSFLILILMQFFLCISCITIFVNSGMFWHFETVTNTRTWIKSHRYWRMVWDA